MLAGRNQNRNTAAGCEPTGKCCDLAGAKRTVGICRDHPDNTAPIGQKAACKVIDLIAELFGSFQHFLACRRRDTGAWCKGAGHGGARYASLQCDFVRADKSRQAVRDVMLSLCFFIWHFIALLLKGHRP